MPPKLAIPTGRVEYGAPDSAHAGRVAAALARLTGLQVSTCQRMLGDGRAMELAAAIIDAHIAAGDLVGLVHRIAPVERALARVPVEAYDREMESAETVTDGDEDIAQVRYLNAPTDEHARARIRANEREVVQLQRINRATAARHGLAL